MQVSEFFDVGLRFAFALAADSGLLCGRCASGLEVDINVASTLFGWHLVREGCTMIEAIEKVDDMTSVCTLR